MLQLMVCEFLKERFIEVLRHFRQDTKSFAMTSNKGFSIYVDGSMLIDYAQPVDTDPADAQPTGAQHALMVTNDAAVGAKLRDEEVDNMLAEVPMVVLTAPPGLLGTYYAHHGDASSPRSEAPESARG